MEDFIGVALYFEEAIDRTFEHVRSAMRKDGLAFYEQTLNPTHLTLGLYVGLPAQTTLDWTRGFCATHSAVPLDITHVESFASDVLFAGVRKSEELLRLHRDFHAKYDDRHGVIGLPYALHGGLWVPHVTIASQVKDMPRAKAIAEQYLHAQTIRPQGLTVCSFYPPTELARFPFA